MFRKILTFGYDACHRWTVLRFRGFQVQECESIRDLREQLLVSTNVDAVIMVEDVVSVPTEAILAAKSYFDGPLVLFEGRYPVRYECSFDLRIPNLSDPSDWLVRIEALINHQRLCKTAEHFKERV